LRKFGMRDHLENKIQNYVNCGARGSNNYTTHIIQILDTHQNIDLHSLFKANICRPVSRTILKLIAIMIDMSLIQIS